MIRKIGGSPSTTLKPTQAFQEGLTIPRSLEGSSYTSEGEKTLRQDIGRQPRPKMVAANIIGGILPSDSDTEIMVHSDPSSPHLREIYKANRFLTKYSEDCERGDLLSILSKRGGVEGQKARMFKSHLNKLQILLDRYEKFQATYFHTENQEVVLANMNHLVTEISQENRVIQYHPFRAYLDAPLKASGNA